MTFQTTIATAEGTTSTGESTGFSAPLLRAGAHIITALLKTAERSDENNNDILQELQAAYRHLETSAFWTDESNLLSTAIRNQFENLQSACRHAHDEYVGWPPEQREENLIRLANATCSVAAHIDREFTGINANSGTSL